MICFIAQLALDSKATLLHPHCPQIYYLHRFILRADVLIPLSDDFSDVVKSFSTETDYSTSCWAFISTFSNILISICFLLSSSGIPANTPPWRKQFLISANWTHWQDYLAFLLHLKQQRWLFPYFPRPEMLF